MVRIDDEGRGAPPVPPRPRLPAHAAQRRSATESLKDRIPPRRRHRGPLPLWYETFLLLITALVLAIVVKTFVAQAFYIPSGSMEPTLHGCAGCSNNDRILVEKVSYWTGDVQRGDIVVFDDPGGWLGPAEQSQPSNVVQRGLEVFGLFPTGGHLVKRVIGVGGDHVRCCDAQGDIVVNEVALHETYLPPGVDPSNIKFDVQVPDGDLWVMGDNRSFSSDSRAHLGQPGGGFVPVDDVVGKVWAIVWPSSRWTVLHRPDTFDDPALDAGAAG